MEIYIGSASTLEHIEAWRNWELYSAGERTAHLQAACTQLLSLDVQPEPFSEIPSQTCKEEDWPTTADGTPVPPFCPEGMPAPKVNSIELYASAINRLKLGAQDQAPNKILAESILINFTLGQLSQNKLFTPDIHIRAEYALKELKKTT